MLTDKGFPPFYGISEGQRMTLTQTKHIINAKELLQQAEKSLVWSGEENYNMQWLNDLARKW